MLQTGNWHVSCLPKDGGRLKKLSYAGHNLLTGKPMVFRPPSENYGRYETRPVYGYDDCFPTVDACDFPLQQYLSTHDHGELCWLGWQVATGKKGLECTVSSKLLPAQFKRSMIFEQNILKWEFEVINNSDNSLPFQHVMHPLMPLNEITKINLPVFSELVDEMNSKILPTALPSDLTKSLLNQSQGTTNMLLLRDIKDGQMELCFKNKIKLKICFLMVTFLSGLPSPSISTDRIVVPAFCPFMLASGQGQKVKILSP